MTNLLVIGGSDAGIAAGLRAREVDPGGVVTILVADGFPNYSICGLPFYVSGETPDWHQFAHRTRDEGHLRAHILVSSSVRRLDQGDHRQQIRRAEQCPASGNRNEWIS